MSFDTSIAQNPDKIYVDGAWTAASGSDVISLISPDTETEIGRVVAADKADVDSAIASAKQAFDHGPWPRMSPAERGVMLTKMAEHLRSLEPKLAEAWTKQIGGLATMAPGLTGLGTMSVDSAVGLIEQFPFAERVPSQMVDTAIIAREPVGVVVAIAPWNTPYLLMVSKVANALVAGCTVVMKPAPEAPLEAYLIAEAANAAGLPPGVLNLVCSGNEASDHLISNSDVDMVSFTGSTQTGKRIAAVCADRMARTMLELGGKSAVVIRDDFPIEAAAQLLTATICTMSGQVCAMLSRAIVSKDRHDELADAIKAEMAKVPIGYSTDPGTQLGPVAMKRQLEKIEGYIAEGRANADLIAGGNRPSHLNTGYFIEPTLFANVKSDSQIAQEEIFGPVLSLIAAEGDDDAVRIANDSNFGLSGSVLTQDAEAAYRMARQIRTGTIGQNGIRMEMNVPFGGFKQSGIGREGGIEGLKAYTEIKTILLDACPAELADS